MIRLDQVSKCYRLYRRPSHRLLEMLTGRRGRWGEEFWALRDISMQVGEGEAVGIVGPNGAGKSTLLKIIAGTTFATRGDVDVSGRIAALLELGTGFHPEFTGRQNLHINARVLGLSNEEIAELEPEIIAFSELGDFIDNPLRTYSSGMMMRLGFSVAACIRPRVLIVDEALSVGDAYFSQKCVRRIREFLEQGTTLLFVSHDPSLVLTLCGRGYLMNKGQLVGEGSPRDVLESYNRLIVRHKVATVATGNGSGSVDDDNDLDAASADEASSHEPTDSGAIDMVADDNDAAPAKTKKSAGPKNGAAARPAADLRAPLHAGSLLALIENVHLFSGGGDVATRTLVSGESAELVLDILFLAPIENPTVGILIRDRLGLDVFGTNTFLMRRPLGTFRAGDHLSLRWSFRNHLGPGDYTLTAAVHRDRTHVEECFDWVDGAASFKVAPCPDVDHIGLVRLESTVEPDRQRLDTAESLARRIDDLLPTLGGELRPRANETPDATRGAAGSASLLDGWHPPEVAGAEPFLWSQADAGILIRPAGERVAIDAAAWGSRAWQPNTIHTVTLVLTDAVTGADVARLTWPADHRAIQIANLPASAVGAPCLWRWEVSPCVEEADGRRLGLALFRLTTDPAEVARLAS